MMHNYNTIIGVIGLRNNKVSYPTIRQRYGIGNSGIDLIMNRYKESGLSWEDFLKLEPSQAEELIYPPKNIRKDNIPMARLDLLVIDDFGLMDLDLDKCRDFFEVIDSRDSQKSTIIVSQLPVKSWYDLFADNTYADACLDRMVHKAFRLELNGKNMRNPV